MANARFTRDEAILALDVLYTSGSENLSPKSPAIIELSDLLNKLPVYSEEKHSESFRNPSGVCNQLLSFSNSLKKGKKDPNVGIVFYDVADEFCERKQEMHSIASAIRRNIACFRRIAFGNALEDIGALEGTILGHFHLIIERRDGSNMTKGQRCEICHIDPSSIYEEGDSLLSLHLMIPIMELDGRRSYKASDFITVCPTCHAALHRHRPWLGSDKCQEILR